MTAVLAAAVCCTAAAQTNAFSSYEPAVGTTGIPDSAAFVIGEVENVSGFSFPPGDTRAFNLAQAMRSSLQDELRKENPLANTDAYTIHIRILGYEPGINSPLGRATQLYVEAAVFDAGKKKMGDIPAFKSIKPGGIPTMGAYKFIFDDVAKEIVTRLKPLENRQSSMPVQ